MKKTVAVSAFLSAVLSSGASFAADSYLSSPAFVQQISGSSFSSMSTASIMKPVMDMAAQGMPAFEARPSAGNLADTLQIGDANIASIDQTGVGNIGAIQQVGYMNTASITQVGNNHQAFISQQGRNNVAIIHQR
jgi:hypothetical protein